MRRSRLVNPLQEIAMSKFVVIALAALFVTAAAQAAEPTVVARPAQPAAVAAPATPAHTAPLSQQEKMRECNKQATGKKGAERKAFMKTCLSKKA
jgi:hypothetical protein